MNVGACAVAVRRGAGLMRELPRGVIQVVGSDRTRWLNSMITNDVSSLAVGPANSGRYAALLSPKGRIIADLQVLERGDAYWLDIDAAAVACVLETLGRYIIADDVELVDRSADFDRLGLEGPTLFELVRELASGLEILEPDACTDVDLGGSAMTVARFGWSGEAALQFFTPAGTGAELADRLFEAGTAAGLVEASGEVLETLRIEAGIPRFGAELDESVLPAEAGLDRAISIDKGCYLGQEVVERMRSQGQASHRLVGLVAAGEESFVPGETLSSGGKSVGEVTSACRSEGIGPIALAFVRRAFAEPGSRLEATGRDVSVASLPFVAGSPPRREP
ncbi:MAG: aminomethyltransferase family protein [Deltaproteobacteria bacterium]|nr:aminomethyltransferase family protein [Deltaproteobacteria bacterium]MBW2399770.1 aminomethyltransferase family protein [Deltaproteobacteria bacterium]MBW2664918.1 aminomethyltransferase family protein [Deltaproteobacteria bacterium]